ncbi:nucleoside-diphosphate sugar epimerase [Bacillus thuringiensis]|uniref:NAD-dependent epimerase/dehydratase family protein n=1 Tax=Bacillus thuringiensis TaxID=1428 RepID=UPI000BEC9899|nr:NAD(P)-dependent oxidoreductase [Bacillus thuringiensis]PEA14534.1 nucleoside-diphosphate sugar epimerase [Bacillus thuringiensis]PEF08160.1 nucleoside-diphosphate sugar epimerase [Bacillus thuringiensis]PFI28376.1 nucleoside-diphosphate sugar epimerase [Bacillus thuringiensis]PFP81883.1 nucleoside-diphosphate sugar epimerase [Bacillus thuringiensis]
MIVLIGATSFIGVYTVEELLKQKCEIVVTGRNDKFKEHYEKLGVKYINLDLTNKNDFSKLPKDGVEGVILLGGLLPANAPVNLDETENAADYFAVNTIGTINVLEYCRENNIKRVISTCSYADVYNSWNENRPLTEDEPRGFMYKGDHAAYVMSKNAATDIMEYYNQQHGMSNAVFRLPPVYGVGPHGSLYINGKYVKSGLQVFIDQAVVGEDITIYGNKNLSRDVVYVKDVAHAFYLAMKSSRTSGLYNMTSGKSVTLQRQVEVISKIFANSPERESKIKYKPEIQNNTPSYIFSMEKAKRDFGFAPMYSDFEFMMTDYKKDMDENKFKNLFKY